MELPAYRLKTRSQKSFFPFTVQAYKDIKGLWTDGNLTLGIDHVQSDAYAAPSRCHVEVPVSSTSSKESAYQLQ